MSQFYKALATSKQAVHQMLNRMMVVREEQGNVLRLVERVRGDHPTLGCRAMYTMIAPAQMGRDAFERMCKEAGYGSVRPVNRRRTTDSNGVIRFDNLLVDLVLSGMDQAWSSDITYFEVSGRFYYITFVMDCYSRRILGHSTSARLTTEHTTLRALKMAVKTREGKVDEGLIFHSDGGGQYYDKGFLAYTAGYGMRNSMCGYAWENGIAERLNGIIKNNYLIHWEITNQDKLVKSVHRSVRLFNTDRPHKSLGNRNPAQFEKEMVTLQRAKQADDDRVICGK